MSLDFLPIFLKGTVSLDFIPIFLRGNASNDSPSWEPNAAVYPHLNDIFDIKVDPLPESWSDKQTHRHPNRDYNFIYT